MDITVKAVVQAPLAQAWECYTDPAHIVHWNAASDDWHCPRAESELRAGGRFCYRMEARDGSAGFDFEGRFEAVEPQRLIRYRFGDRQARVEFSPAPDGTRVRVDFQPENEYPLQAQRQGWQAILDRYAAYAAARAQGLDP